MSDPSVITNREITDLEDGLLTRGPFIRATHEGIN